jgi:ribosomal RNA-processing protein 17
VTENEESGSEEDGSEDEEFTGFDEPPPQQLEEIDREDEYIDEDKYTTVTVESVAISKEGFEKTKSGGKEGGEGDNKENDGEREAKKRVWTKERPKTDRPKKRKKKFRYETKAERKETRMKQGARNRKEAAARKAK